MTYLPHKESQPSITSSLNLFNAENVDVSVKHGYYEQFHPQQPLSENIHFQIFSNEDYFIDLSSTFIDLNVVVKKKSDNQTPSAVDGVSYENCILHNLFRQINVYINGTLVSTSNNLSNYASYIQFMLMTPKSYKELRGQAMGYEYRLNVDTDGELTTAVTKEYHLVGKLNHEIFNISQWLPPNVKIDIKLQLAPGNFILRKTIAGAPDATVNLTSAVLHVRKQQVMSSVALAVEKLRANGNNIKLLVPHTVTNQRHIATGSRNYTDSSFISGEIPSKLALAFVRSASAVGSWTTSPHDFNFFGLSSLVCKVNGVPLYNLSFDNKSYRTLYELTMQSLDHDSQLFENGITDSIFSKTHGVIVLDLSGTQDLTVVRTGSVRLECTFADALTESITLISLCQFETYWEITPDGSVLLDLAP
jgi:hypothetical protein